VSSQIEEGDTLLLLDVIEFENRVHSVQLRNHPRHGDGTLKLMVQEFLDSFVPCKDAESIRQREQQAVMNRVTSLQNELMEAQMNPQLMIEAIRPDVDREMKNMERELDASAQRSGEATKERTDKLAKVHRRAARRSEAKGNPLALPKIALASEVGSVIEQGIDASGVAELSKMAHQQAVVAQAQSNWLSRKTSEITSTLKELAPYVSERAAVALARSSGALKMAQRIKRGIESLDLYTGKDVDVFDVCTGAPAATTEPLTLIQGKRYAEEELAAWADVDASFDFRNKEEFFKVLGENKALRDQMLPFERCVVSVAMLRNNRQYETVHETVMNNIRNHFVFLLVRNGENIHVVYSGTPSHEGAPRLFPTEDELDRPFRGWDGSRVSIRDIEFGERMVRFDDIALSYKRFLILLCGLDHRLKLLGDFYPEAEQMQFMTQGFQERHFRFIADDEENFLIGRDMPQLEDWVSHHNKMIQSGSRVFALSSVEMQQRIPELKRRTKFSVKANQFNVPKIVTKDAGQLIMRVAVTNHWDTENEEFKCELSDKNNKPHEGLWWLCVDGVDIRDVRNFISSRIHRSMGVGYLRLMRRLESYLQAELDEQSEVRAYLMEMATTHGGLTPEVARETLSSAIRNWRAAHRGESLPGIDNKKAINEVLSLMVPEGQLPEEMFSMLKKHIDSTGIKPLLLTRSGKSKFILYVEASAEDRAAYPNLLNWGWVKRQSLEIGKTKMKLASESLVWLGEVLSASETEIRRWDGLESWMNKEAEPVNLRKYMALPALLNRVHEQWGPIMSAGPGSGIPQDMFDRLFERGNELHDSRKTIHVNVVLCLPVAAYSDDGRVLNVVYAKALLDSVLFFFGNAEQKERVRHRFVRRFRDKERGMRILQNLRWFLVTSSEDISHDGSIPLVDGLAKENPSTEWAARKILVQRKKSEPSRNFFNTLRGGKESGQPLDSFLAALSFNRAFDQLMGVGVKNLKKMFYAGKAEQIKRTKNWPHERHLAKEKIAALQSERYEHKRIAIASPLVWSEKNNRSHANTFFNRKLELCGG
jgi:hypothetical protein